MLPYNMTPYHTAGYHGSGPTAGPSIMLTQGYVLYIYQAFMKNQTMKSNNSGPIAIPGHDPRQQAKNMATPSFTTATGSDGTSRPSHHHQQQEQEQEQYYYCYIPEITTEELIIGIVLKDLPAYVFIIVRQAVIFALCAVIGLIEFSCVMAFRFSVFVYMAVFAFAEWGYNIGFGAVRLVVGLARDIVKGVWRVGKAIGM